MAVQTATAAHLVEEVFLFGRVLRGALGGGTETGLPPALTGVLFVLAHSAPCRQNELAVSLCVSQSALSRQIADLVDAGLVARRPDPDDGRASLVELTDAGRRILADSKARRADNLRERLADWSQDEAEAALAALRHLIDTFSIPARTPAAGAITPNEGGHA
ncbi:MarR family winged helix-turn-helix transcriptional regulator [Rhodococcus gannanensis]|jgi:DNA-binding MarR family transcriptional regulator|uniref:MarR family winged helix-turn-helix transcriptional regulator n=1 Tax=Rhodococcus gannanensis TaxID=1960308 RepID=A0ABW4P7M7_9NOCA